MSHLVRQAGLAELPQLAGVLGRSLIADPVFQWLYDGAATAQDISAFTEKLYAQATELGLVWQAGGGRGVAVWVPPGGEVVDSSQTSGPEPRSTDSQGPNPDETWSWIESFVPDDAWYLEVLGVDPDAQGAGLGGALVRHGLELAREDGAGAFLETFAARNVRYYERFGFNVVDEDDVPGKGPHVWFMRFD